MTTYREALNSESSKIDADRLCQILGIDPNAEIPQIYKDPLEVNRELLQSSTDPTVWATELLKVYAECDLDTMVIWFADYWLSVVTNENPITKIDQEPVFPALNSDMIIIDSQGAVVFIEEINKNSEMYAYLDLMDPESGWRWGEDSPDRKLHYDRCFPDIPE